MRHMSPLQTAALEAGATPHAHPGSAETGAASMGGLVMGITVRPRPDHVAPAEGPRRRLALHIGMRPAVFDGEPAYGFVLRDGAAPASDSVRFPGSPIMLTRGEPAEIVVHNRADVALGVHWHGLELESWADGVPGWSGYPDAIRPAVAPNDSFVVRMTPPRAGTFMYHVHSEPGHQLALGLYGAFLVTEQGAPSNADTDRLFLLGSLGAGDDPPAAVYGELAPGQMELRAGTEYRLRFMHISPNDNKVVRLLGAGGAESWRIVAKDGADLPETQARTIPAELRIGVGETYDFLWSPRPGEYTLRIVTMFDRGVPAFPRTPPPPDTTDIIIDAKALQTPAAPRQADTTDALRYEATIRRTSYGIPHIVAADLARLGFGEAVATKAARSQRGFDSHTGHEVSDSAAPVEFSSAALLVGRPAEAANAFRPCCSVPRLSLSQATLARGHPPPALVFYSRATLCLRKYAAAIASSA
jgi:FtsP/CotA-like multicopper oxidase with cupredoxin domain